VPVDGEVRIFDGEIKVDGETIFDGEIRVVDGEKDGEL